MLLPIRTLLFYRPGQLALLTILGLIPVGIAVASTVTEPSAGLVAVFLSGGTIGAVAMLGGFVLSCVPAARHFARGLVAYGAAIGVIVFAALTIASVASCAAAFA